MSDKQNGINNPLPLASWWYAAGVSGYAWPKTWQAWAARFIASSPAPVAWIIELSKAKCIIDLEIVLESQVAIENLDPVTIGNAILGYVWLRYEREELQLYDCLCNAVSLAEDHPSSISPKAIYALLNNLRFDNQEQTAQEGKMLFCDCKMLATNQFKNLK